MKKIFTLFFFCFTTVVASAQLFVDTSYAVEQMMYDFFDTSGIPSAMYSLQVCSWFST